MHAAGSSVTGEKGEEVRENWRSPLSCIVLQRPLLAKLIMVPSKKGDVFLRPAPAGMVDKG